MAKGLSPAIELRRFLRRHRFVRFEEHKRAGVGSALEKVERFLADGDPPPPGKTVAVVVKRLLERAPVHHRLDFAKVMERMRRLRARIAPNDSAERFRNLGVDVFIGEGRFTGTDTIEAGGKTLKFSKAVIATGARAVDLPMP